MSILIKKKTTGIEYWIEQEDWDRMIDLKMTKDYDRINPANTVNKKVETPPEIIEFMKNKAETKVKTKKK